MVQKSLFLALLLFIIYNIKLATGSKVFPHSQHQQQENIMKVQEYIHNIEKVDYVLLGSSITYRIPGNDSIFQLGLAGSSAIEALKVVLSTKRITPKVILIETNTIFRDVKEASETWTHPILVSMRDWLPALREKHQPISILYAYAKPYITSNSYKLTKEQRSRIKKATIKPNDILKTSDSLLMNKKCKELVNLLNYTQKIGIKIVFYEVPQDANYPKTSRRLYTLNLLRLYFPDVSFISLPEQNGYRSTDGIHLEGQSSSKYRDYLIKKIEEL